ncbi:MAG: DUF2892 domain-containing protein [Chitinispirillales bacterium]|nr:DUF2892 domain-containing protein [Chitinispirillales bacterium]
MKIEKNEGKSDRIIRVFIVVILYITAIFFVQGTAKIFCLFFATAMAITTIFGWCPLYILFGFNTCGQVKEDTE